MMKLILITHPRASILEMGWYSLSHCAPWDFPLPAAFVIPLSFPMVLSPLLTLHWVEHILLSLFCSWEVVDIAIMFLSYRPYSIDLLHISIIEWPTQR